jgi:RNA polymerase sigma-70 factor (ECF subfamily)
MARITQGDQQALGTLYDHTSALVYGLAWRILQDQGVAEDITIEVYTQVQQQAASYDPTRGTPSAWLIMLTRSRAIDRLRMESRRRQREVPLEMAVALPSSAPDPEECSAVTELRRVVQTALAALSPEQRQVVEIAYYEGRSHSEIAARLGQPLGTVKTRLRTAMLVLHRLLKPFLANAQL